MEIYINKYPAKQDISSIEKKAVELKKKIRQGLKLTNEDIDWLDWADIFLGKLDLMAV